MLVCLPTSISYENSTFSIRTDQFQRQKPIIYTYYERIPLDRRLTDMTDEDDDALLEYWKSSWETAGWTPIVLGKSDAEQHPKFELYNNEIKSLRMDDFGEIVFRRYIAMATKGGWMCDYDIFPLRDFRSEGLTLPYDGKFAIFDVVSSALAVADQGGWESTLRALLDDAKMHLNKNENQINLWTDTLGMIQLLRNDTLNVKSHRLVMPANLMTEPVPFSSEFCAKRQFRKKHLVIHFSPQSMLEGKTIPPEQRLPRYRAETARETIPHYETYCGVKIVNNEFK